MFRSSLLRPGTILSDGGFCVTLKSRYRLEYEDANGLIVNLNYDAGTTDLDLLMLSLEASKDGAGIMLDAAQRSAAIEQIVAALSWKGYNVHLIESR